MTKCGLGNAGVAVLAAELASNITLKELHLRENDISVPGAIALANALAKNTTLNQLYLGFNPIWDEGVKALAGTKLKYLDLYDTRITERGVKYFFNNTSLTELSLMDTKFDKDTQSIIDYRIKRNQQMSDALPSLLSCFSSCSLFGKKFGNMLLPEILEQIYTYMFKLNGSIIVSPEIFVSIIRKIFQQSSDKQVAQLTLNDDKKIRNFENVVRQHRVEELQVLEAILNHSTFWRNRGEPTIIIAMCSELDNYRKSEDTPFTAWENMRENMKIRTLFPYENQHEDVVELRNAIMKSDIDALKALEKKAAEEELEEEARNKIAFRY
jgi:hypothetical protein